MIKRGNGMPTDWKPRAGEKKIPFDPIDKEKYMLNRPDGRYYKVRWNPEPISEKRRRELASAEGKDYWKTMGGRGARGEFPLVVAREYYRADHYTVWASEPRLVHPETREPEGFVVLSYAGARNPRHTHHHNYQRMADIFGADLLERLNRKADAEKKRRTGNRAGGDPDLFVFKGDRKNDRFFVEVKYEDQLTQKQTVCFPLIERILECEVRAARIYQGEISLP
jgi:hypothetical protein